MTTLNSLLHTPWTFTHPTKELYTSSVDSAKYFLDPLASSVSDSQHARLQNSKKRKRFETERADSEYILHVKQLYAEGFTTDQIWEQATRILGAAGVEVERDSALNSRHQSDLPSENKNKVVQFDDVGSEDGRSERHGSKQELSDEAVDGYSDKVDEESDLPSEDLNDESDGIGSDDGSMDGDDDSKKSEENEQDVYVEDPFGLNDGFFSIDDFNKQTEAFERQDAKGGPDDDEDSEEEEIDWHADPFATGGTTSAMKDAPKKRRRNNEDSESESSDEEGPTFGDADLRGNWDSDADEDSDVENEGDASWMNTNDIKYSDFFAPPAKPASAKKSRPLPKTQPKTRPNEEEVENDLEHAMADVRRDIFEDDASDEDEDGLNGDSNTGEPHSTHEQNRARVADEIRRLEAANVEKKDWMLAGEARAADRPVNSLIEEDLDFERIGKPVPVVTNEVTEDIEELVKRRILSKEFDEVIRRQPGAITDSEIMRKGRPELDDTKPQKSLAELYETDHLRATDPNYVDTKDLKLKREHADIASLWKEIGSQLDTLSNWHYKPKAPQASIDVVTDVPTVLMEEARPTVTGTVGTSEALAPQEIYTPGGDGKAAGELIRKSGVPVSKEEMTREEKAKWRRQRKEQQKKTGSKEVKPQQGKAAEKQQLASNLEKGGVKVIGKQGEVTNIYGDKVNQSSSKQSAETLKL